MTPWHGVPPSQRTSNFGVAYAGLVTIPPSALGEQPPSQENSISSPISWLNGREKYSKSVKCRTRNCGGVLFLADVVSATLSNALGALRETDNPWSVPTLSRSRRDRLVCCHRNVGACRTSDCGKERSARRHVDPALVSYPPVAYIACCDHLTATLCVVTFRSLIAWFNLV